MQYMQDLRQHLIVRGQHLMLPWLMSRPQDPQLGGIEAHIGDERLRAGLWQHSGNSPDSLDDPIF